jgi:hypothetical protein
MQAASWSVVGLIVVILLCLLVVGGVVAAIAFVVYLLSRKPTPRHSDNPNLQPCPDCGQFISVRAVTCPFCGGPVKAG